MPKRKLVAAILAIALGAALGGALVMAAPWTDTQTASGTVTVSSTQDELYICDVTGVTDPRLPPEAPPAAFNWCVGDDSGPDETILETDEALTPNSAASWDFYLVNIGTADWDITQLTTTITETVDPGADCTNEPVVLLSNLSGGGHTPGTEPYPGSPVISGEVAHAPAGGALFMRINASLPGSLPAECQGNAWDIVLQFDVSTH